MSHLIWLVYMLSSFIDSYFRSICRESGLRTPNTCPLIPAVWLFSQGESARGISCRTVEVQYLLRQRNLSLTIPHKIIWRTKVPPIENKIIVSIVPKKNPAFPDPNFLLKDYQVNYEDSELMIWNYP